MIPDKRVHPSDEVVALAGTGRKIEAIKLLRQEQGLGLREAKEIVDALDLPAQAIRPSAGREDRGGFRLLVMLVLLVVGALAFLLLGESS